MIETDYTTYRHSHSLMKANEYEKVIRESLIFLRSVAEEYMRLELYNNQEYDGDGKIGILVNVEIVRQ